MKRLLILMFVFVLLTFPFSVDAQRTKKPGVYGQLGGLNLDALLEGMTTLVEKGDFNLGGGEWSLRGDGTGVIAETELLDWAAVNGFLPANAFYVVTFQMTEMSTSDVAIFRHELADGTTILEIGVDGTDLYVKNLGQDDSEIRQDLTSVWYPDKVYQFAFWIESATQVYHYWLNGKYASLNGVANDEPKNDSGQQHKLILGDVGFSGDIFMMACDGDLDGEVGTGRIEFFNESLAQYMDLRFLLDLDAQTNPFMSNQSGDYTDYGFTLVTGEWVQHAGGY